MLILAAVASIVVPSSSALAQAPAADDDVATGEPPVPPTTVNYVTTTTAPDKSLDVSAFSPTCIRDVPYINFTIVPKGFSSSGPATLTFFDVNGNFVEQVISPTLSGQIIYPGATAGPNGEGLDWPGWTLAPDGSWIQDPSDAILRDGLTVQVQVNPTAITTVSYPPSTSACANPPRSTPPTTTPPTCVPGENNDGTPDDDCTLPRTGGGVANPLAIGGAAVVSGLVFLVAARRRRAVSSS
jgi:LPXTG-motif cell wall-anchored protein